VYACMAAGIIGGRRAVVQPTSILALTGALGSAARIPTKDEKEAEDGNVHRCCSFTREGLAS